MTVDWRPASGPRAAATRAAILRRIRKRFDAEGLLEVDTPALGLSAVSDTQIESLAIADCLVSPAPLYLHTSPEFCMKRLLAAGYPDIYSICRVFRDGEAGRRHQPEFTMVEWYRLGFEFNEIIDDTLALIVAALGDRAPRDAARQVEYRDAFIEAAGVDPFEDDIDALAGAIDADADLRRALGDERDDWLDLVLAQRVIPSFDAGRLTVLRHYPASQAALARRCPGNARVADRFEVFLGAVELANGYVELTDAREQRARIEADNAERRRRGRALRPVDEALLDALETGLPDCAGVAMGFERLQMLHDRTDDIRDVITFAFTTNS
jgi:lysyl-tRNA synthetase class 2